MRRITQVRQQIAVYGTEDAVIAAALDILRSRIARARSPLTSPGAVRDYLRLNLAERQAEAFWVIYCDSQNRVIASEEAFRGTLACTSVYPREIVKRALEHNAGAVIFAHNHPSGVAEPSYADEAITRQLKSALALVEVKVLDHFIVGGDSIVSFAERGLI